MNNLELTIGIDEVGRGALAGPVFLGGVLLDNSYPAETYGATSQDETKNHSFFQVELHKSIRDSKKTKAQTREAIYRNFRGRLSGVNIKADNTEIDDYGIGVCLSHQLLLVIHLLVSNLDLAVGDKLRVIIDGKIKVLHKPNKALLAKICISNRLDPDTIQSQLKSTLSLINPSPIHLFSTPGASVKLVRENKADDKYLSVAMSSIFAKVERDSYMKIIGRKYPHFEWDINKGYGTEKHIRVIKDNPVNEFLRKTFITKILAASIPDS